MVCYEPSWHHGNAVVDLAGRMSHHYFFPPAAGYPLNRCLYRLKSDAAFRERYLADPEPRSTRPGSTPSASRPSARSIATG